MREEMRTIGNESITIVKNVAKAGLAAVGIGLLTKVSRDSVKEVTESGQVIGRVAKYTYEEWKAAKELIEEEDMGEA